MVVPTGTTASSQLSSLTDRCISTSQKSPISCFKAVCCLTLLLFVWSFASEKKVLNHSNSTQDDQDFHKVVAGRTRGSVLQRCIDVDDPEEWKDFVTAATCQCADPLAAAPRYKAPKWDAHHQRLIQAASTATSVTKEGTKPTVVWIGDSIVERWNGTRTMGSKQVPGFLPVFQSYFGNDSPAAPFDGLALGTSGDTSVELLWHLKHGMLPDSLQPDVWIIVIGTNDLGRWDCSKRTTLAGILHVAQFLHTARPNTPILLHGLLPRSDDYGQDPVDYSLGRRWEQILWINRELKKFCSLHEEWYYMESNKIFLRKAVVTVAGDGDSNNNNMDLQGQLEILPSTMEDALHPNIEGYRQWGLLIVDKLQKILKK